MGHAGGDPNSKPPPHLGLWLNARCWLCCTAFDQLVIGIAAHREVAPFTAIGRISEGDP